MKTLHQELDRYLEIRRSLGYKLATEERILRRFVAFVRQSRASHITSELFLRWQKKFGRARQDTWGHRLSAVRVFARWLHGLDARHEVPPAALIPYRLRRPRRLAMRYLKYNPRFVFLFVRQLLSGKS